MSERAAPSEGIAAANKETRVQPEEINPIAVAAGRSAKASALPLYGYYASNMLTRMPEGIGTFDIQPPAGGDAGIGGKMTLRIWIGAAGGIDALRVVDSGLPAAYEQAALAAFEKMRFKPGEISGVPVKSVVEIVIEYADFRNEAQRGLAESR